MSKNLVIAIGVLVVAGAAGFAGNWWGAHHAAGSPAVGAMESVSGTGAPAAVPK